MRRAALQAFRTARRTHIHKNLSWKGSPFTSSSLLLGLRSGTTVHRINASNTILQSSMYLRNFSVALISAAVASGAWYAFKRTPNAESGVLGNINHPSSAGSYSGTLATSNTYSNSPHPTVSSGTAEEVAASTRRALVVENDQFYTGDILGDQPLSKETGGSGRVVVEMLTPEQATQKLRQNEESYAVGRGRGVVRYDVTQLASNHPIEDDHAEKIVEVSQTIAATQDGSPAADWMFWGVFDGHRFVWTPVELS